MKRVFQSALGVLFAVCSVSARPVSELEAEHAVRVWLARTPRQLDTKLAFGQTVSTHAVRDGGDAALFHVVSLDNGGFVVTSADTGVEPIIAISDSGELKETRDNPLFAILLADMSNRLDQVSRKRAEVSAAESAAKLAASASGQRAAAVEQPFAKSESKWAELLRDEEHCGSNSRQEMSLSAKSGYDYIDDVRVSPLIQTAWGQSSGAANCYTPNNYVCGCVALAGAQIARFWQFPTSYCQQVSRECSVSGSSVSRTTMGGIYAWSSMPLTYSSLSSSQKQAIGKLCYDFGVATYMDWGPNGSGTGGYCLDEAFRRVFGYANSRVYVEAYSDAISQSVIEKTILSNLDAGCPVSLGIYGHMIDADGYGYNSGTLFTHLNLGWSGSYDAWYNLPVVNTFYDSSVLDTVIYNIFPNKTGELLTGRVLDRYGNPVSGAVVSAAGATITTGAKGIYAFWVTGGQSWTVTASYDGASGSTSAYVPSSVSTTITGKYYRPGTGTPGNSWGNDITLSISGPSAPAAPSWVYASDGYYSDFVYVEWDGSDNASSYTVYRSTSSYGSKSCLGSTFSTDFYDYDAMPGTTYYYWVTASNDAGESGFSQYDSGYRSSSYSAPSAPSGVYASQGDYSDRVYIDWDWSDDASYYSVYRSTSQYGSKTYLGYTYSTYMSDYDATPGVTYYYWVTASNDYGESEYSSYATGYCSYSSYTPSAPSGVYASQGSYSDHVEIEWDWSDDASYYSVYRSTSQYGSKTYLGYTSSTYMYDYDAAPGVTYYYWVTASNDYGESDYSSYATGWLYVSQDSSLSDALDNWDLSFTTGGNADWFEQYDETWDWYDAAQSGSISHNQKTWFETEVYGEGTVSFMWKVSSESGYDFLGLYVDGAQVRQISGSTSWDQVTASITGSGSHTIRWTYSKDGSVSSGSDCGWVDQVAWQPTTDSSPTAPSWIYASQGDYSDCVYIDWDWSDDASYYKVYRSTSQYGSKTYLGYTYSTYMYDYDATPGVTYYYWVTASNEYGESDYSSYATGYCSYSSYTPSAPSWVSASQGYYSDCVEIEWDWSDDASYYTVYRSTSQYGSKTYLGYTYSTYMYDYDADPGVTYYYWVTASNGSGESEYSPYATGWLSAPQGTSLSEALDNWGLSFTTGGYSDWFGQTTTTCDGVDAAQSGDIYDSSSTWMETTLSGPGTLTFWWKVSSESGYDFLGLYVDGAKVRQISGSTSWDQVTATITGSGSHTVRWTYSKDSSQSDGSDCGWVDEVVWTPAGGGGGGGDPDNGKYALCVGLNEYEYASSLSGCANDAKYFRNSLVEYGDWAQVNTTLLVDNGATKNAIRAAIANYAARAVAGDTFVYVHSSHGGQHGGSSSKSVYLCTFDENYEDTELAEDLGLFRSGVKIAVIVDACHSGGLFKGDVGKGGAAGIAQRVTALMDENRAKRMAKGEKTAALKIASSEIGWVTAADYDESSIDWGFYDTDSWLWDPYAEGGEWGGTFLGSFVWSWWNGSADYSGVGDGDGLADPYECWSVAYDFCTSLGEFWGGYDVAFTPQYLNRSALRQVELGFCGDGPVVQPPMSLRDALDNTSLTFTTGGGANWSGQTATTHDGTDAAQSGSIGDSASSWMQTTVSGAGTLSFWWKVSSENDWDFLTLYVDGASVDEISGQTSWIRVTRKVSGTGSHTIRWKYTKDSSVSSGSDCGWVDQVSWTRATQYKVAFNANGGSGRMATRTLTYGVSSSLPKNTFTRKGYVFLGWAKSKKGAVVYRNTQSVRNLSANGGTFTLYAKWAKATYKVAFNGNGGKRGKSVKAVQSIAYGKSTNLSANKFKRKGYVFLGWAKSKNGAVAYANKQSVKNLSASGATIQLYAKWAKKIYKVAFYANGGKGGKKVQRMTYGKARKLSANTFKRTGYLFLGWAKSKNGAVFYKNKQSVKNLTTNGKTVKLYAKWAKKTYYVAFNANGGKGKMAVQKMTYGKATKLSANKFTRSGYSFAGWAKTSGGAACYSNCKSVKNLVANGSTVRLYAVWRAVSRPRNDNFYNAIEIDVSKMNHAMGIYSPMLDTLEYYISGNNKNATVQSGEPRLIDNEFVSWGYTYDASVWWKWTAPADGYLQLNTFRPNNHHSIALFRGWELDYLEQIAFSRECWGGVDGGGFYQSLDTPVYSSSSGGGVPVYEGETYYIAVSSLKSLSSGKCTTGDIYVYMYFWER